MKCNIELLYKTIKAQMENDLVLVENDVVSNKLKERYSHEAAVLSAVLSMIENENLLKQIAKTYETI